MSPHRTCGVGAGRLNRFSPDGELIAWVEMPVRHPTMPCFGGADGRSLYVTSLSEHHSAADLARASRAGGLFVLEPGVSGAVAARFKG